MATRKCRLLYWYFANWICLKLHWSSILYMPLNCIWGSFQGVQAHSQRWFQINVLRDIFLWFEIYVTFLFHLFFTTSKGLLETFKSVDGSVSKWVSEWRDFLQRILLLWRCRDQTSNERTSGRILSLFWPRGRKYKKKYFVLKYMISFDLNIK